MSTLTVNTLTVNTLTVNTLTVNTLITQPNFSAPGPAPLHAYMPGDQFYEQLIHSHQGLSDEQSRLVNARLILLLANHIGDLAVLQQALAAARAGVAPKETST